MVFSTFITKRGLSNGGGRGVKSTFQLSTSSSRKPKKIYHFSFVAIVGITMFALLDLTVLTSGAPGK